MSFHPFCLSSKHNKQGEVISLQLHIRGWTLKRLDDLCAMWTLSSTSGRGWTQRGVRNEVRSCTPGSWRVKQGWACFSSRRCQLRAFQRVRGSWRGAASCSEPSVHDLFQRGLASQQWLRQRWRSADLTWQSLTCSRNSIPSTWWHLKLVGFRKISHAEIFLTSNKSHWQLR